MDKTGTEVHLRFRSGTRSGRRTQQDRKAEKPPAGFIWEARQLKKQTDEWT